MSDTTDDMEHYEPEEWAEKLSQKQTMNNDDQIPEAEIQPEPLQALQVRHTQPVSTAVDKPAITPEQAKVDAVAELTKTAYARASELKLTADEQASLQKEFRDEAFRPGAAGKENLLYIEHAFLRDRLNEVLGLGQWCIIPRKRWAEDFIIPATRDRDEVQASRVYVEAMLVIRGCFVAEAIGDMVYYKNNQSQNYGDAVEGAKTAALRRCTKELGIGLQAWKKDWCAGWWERNNSNRRPSQNAPGRSGGSQGTAQARPAAPAPQSAPKPPAKTTDLVPPAQPPTEADKDQRFRFLAALSPIRTEATNYFVKKGWLTAGQNLEDMPNKHVPTTKKVYDSLMGELQAWVDGEQHEPDWKSFLMPWGKNKGTPLGELDKKYLYGLFMNWEPEYEYEGKRKSEDVIAKDELFRKMLSSAGAHYDWIKQ